MLFKISLESQRRIFQSQLSALLQKQLSFVDAVDRIEAKASPALKEMISEAKRFGSAPTSLIDGLVEVGLFSPEMSAIARAAEPLKIDTESYLRRHLAKETEFNRIQSAIMGPINTVVWTFVLMGIFFFFSYLTYRMFIFPRFNFEEGDPTLLLTRSYMIYSLLSFFLLAVFSAFLVCVYLALKFNRSEHWKPLRFLWYVPGLAKLFRKRITWRIFTSCQILVNAGVDQATAMETCLRSTRLRLRKDGDTLLFPESSLLDAASVGAANLGSSLDTFGEQLGTAVGLLEQELPYAAQGASRFIYYVGYVLMGLLVCTLLVQMYAPIIRMSNIVDF